MVELGKWSMLGLAFLVELIALAVFALWGWHTGQSTAVRLLLVIGLPVVAAGLWGLIAAPKAPRGGPWASAVVKVAFFGLAGLALWSLDHRPLAVAFVLVVAANLLIIRIGDLDSELPASAEVHRNAS